MVTERLNEACYKFCTEITKAALVLLQSWVLAWMMQNTSSKSAKSDFNLFRFSSGGRIGLVTHYLVSIMTWQNYFLGNI